MFHIIEDGPSPLCFPIEQFRRAMSQLKDNGYQTLRLTEAARCLRLGLPLPQRSIVLTFDDGDLSLFEQAWPILQQHNMTATIFMLGSEDRRFMNRPLMSWQQVVEMSRGGIEFGAHTLSHPDLTQLPTKQIEAEICQSKAVIENVLGAAISSFAYPFGRYDERSREIVKQHFDCACIDALGLVGNHPDLHALRRVETYYLRRGRQFDMIFSRHFRWYLRARDIPRRFRRAMRSK